MLLMPNIAGTTTSIADGFLFHWAKTNSEKGKAPQMFNFLSRSGPESQSFSKQLDSRWPCLSPASAQACEMRER